MSFYSFMMRNICTLLDKKRDQGLSTPVDIERQDNILYGLDKKWQLLDVYRPREQRGKLPPIISVHGGGWVHGDKELYQFYCMELARHGFVVINFTYHLAPKFKFPQPLIDTNLVFQWVMDHGDDYGIDTENIFAVGDSAGAHLFALYCAACTNPSYASRLRLCVPAAALPKAVALNCGAYDAMTEKGLVGNLMKDFLTKGGKPEERKLATPLNYVNPDFPPVFLATAPKDFMIGDSLKLKNKLEDLGVPHEYRVFHNADDSLGHVFHLIIRLPEAKLCNDEECSFFREHIKPKRSTSCV